MFGFRADGRATKLRDPIIKLTPYIMPHRTDAQVFTTQYIDADILTQYINEKRRNGIKISHMALIVTAWLRAVCEVPMLNRFVAGNRIYSRNEITLSFVTISGREEGNLDEAVCKVHFSPTDTIFEVNEKIEDAVQKCRESTQNSIVNRLAGALLSIPVLTGLLVGFIKLLDHLGLLPKALIDASPFHTSLFMSNMASIKMNSIYHHIYNFGTTSVFFGMGRPTIRVSTDMNGQLKPKRVYPLGCTIDERIMAGAQYGAAFAVLNSFLRHPERLELPPERVLTDGVPLANAECCAAKS